MPLEIRPVEECDFADFVRIQIAAFSGGGMTTLIKPSPMPSDYNEKSVKNHLKSWRGERDVHYLKVVDTDLGGKMIACAKWRINLEERTQEEVEKTLPVPGEEEEGRPAAQDFYWFLNRVRRQFMGTLPFYFLHMLVTDPEHHRRGAGAMLLKWGTEQADKSQLPCFLEASVVGRPLYARFGFEPRLEEAFDMSKYGSQGIDIATVMIREPSSHVM